MGYLSRVLVGLAMSAAILSLAQVPASAQDPLKVAPGMYKLIFENDRVRVMEVTFKPGERVAEHSHPDHFVYVLTGGKIKITAGEKVTEADVTPGQVLWIPAEKHWAVNVGNTEVRLVVTELKDPVKGAAAPAK
jgi:quercetin dioxygenase-like cupin family protein